MGDFKWRINEKERIFYFRALVQKNLR